VSGVARIEQRAINVKEISVGREEIKKHRVIG
jgi:hypothetical protein